MEISWERTPYVFNYILIVRNKLFSSRLQELAAECVACIKSALQSFSSAEDWFAIIYLCEGLIINWSLDLHKIGVILKNTCNTKHGLAPFDEHY